MSSRARSGVRTYRGTSLAVHYDAKRCIHAAECVHGLPAVFDPDRRPWIEPDGASPADLIAVVERCPTGALHYERADGGAPEAAPGENVVRVSPDGPLYVRGEIAVESHDGRTVQADTRIALCRCGASQNKPFCDGRHEAAGFSDPGSIQDASATEPAHRGSSLRISLAQDGPLVLNGAFRLEGGDGKAAGARDKAALCRCGASANKPYCDGSHVRLDFKSP